MPAAQRSKIHQALATQLTPCNTFGLLKAFVDHKKKNIEYAKEICQLLEGLPVTYPLLLYEANSLAGPGQVSTCQDHMGTMKGKRPGCLKAWDTRRETERHTGR